MVTGSEVVQQRGGVDVRAEAAAEQQRVSGNAAREAAVVVGVRVSVAHRFHHLRVVGVSAGGGQVRGKQAAAATQCRLRRHHRRAGHAAATRDQQQASGVAFVGKAAARAVLRA